jgi:hypothetical protein
MAKRQKQERKPGAAGSEDKDELGYHASDYYKARLTKGLLGVELGEGYIVEILNYRTKRVLRRELFDHPDDARDELNRIREDIDSFTTEDFRRKYLQPPG